jgi:hypothetical protein
LAFWMQTTGARLLAVSRCSSVRVRTHAQDSRSAHGLLYLTAVRDDSRQQEHCQPLLTLDYQLGNERGERCDLHRRTSATSCAVRERPPDTQMVWSIGHAAGTIMDPSTCLQSTSELSKTVSHLGIMASRSQHRSPGSCGAVSVWHEISLRLQTRHLARVDLEYYTSGISRSLLGGHC